MISEMTIVPAMFLLFRLKIKTSEFCAVHAVSTARNKGIVVVRKKV